MAHFEREQIAESVASNGSWYVTLVEGGAFGGNPWEELANVASL